MPFAGCFRALPGQVWRGREQWEKIRLPPKVRLHSPSVLLQCGEPVRWGSANLIELAQSPLTLQLQPLLLLMEGNVSSFLQHAQAPGSLSCASGVGLGGTDKQVSSRGCGGPSSASQC